MSRQALTPDALLDRPWRPARRFTSGGGRIRKWAMIALLALLCLIIAGYVYLTDSDRVRGMAESYLSGLIGGPVKVGGATLSVFEGLRLDNVRVYVDEEGTAPDSLLFSAQTFLIKYDPRTMIAGRLEATQIIAQKPQVHLAENRDAGEWNYQRLARRRKEAAQPAPGIPGRVPKLPDVLLRNARVTISEIQGGREVARGLVAVDGRLASTTDGFSFHLQSRGVSEEIGPYASGSISRSTGQVVAQLMNFQFDRDVRSMLPVQPRDWWERHELAGAVSMPEITFTPGKTTQSEQFKLRTDLKGVTLSISPEEWMGRTEVARLYVMRKTTTALGGLYRYAGAKNARATRLTRLMTPSKITLKGVEGSLVFSNSGIEVKDLSGFIESNRLIINGRIGGYRPDAPLSLHLSSPANESLTVPESPPYLNSLPREVREFYEEFKPEGKIRLAVHVERIEPGSRPVVSGSADILSGQFAFNRFPYPLRNVTGRIEFGHSQSGDGRITLNVRGNGLATGPNRDAVLEIKTFGEGIGPVGTQLCGVNVRITGSNVASEDSLRDAFPTEVREALTNFDAQHTGKLPQYRGDFMTEIVRPTGLNKRWSFDTDISLKDASAVLAAFPYPLQNLTGKILIRSGYAQLVDLRMQREGGGSLAVGGRYAWTTSDGPRGPQPAYHAAGAALSPRVGEPVKTELAIVVKNMPIDEQLLSVIPPDQREWVGKLGAKGTLDAEGRVFSTPRRGAGADVEWVVEGKPNEPREQVAYDLKLAVRDATLKPLGGAFEASQVNASLRLTPEELLIERVTGRRGEGELFVSGRIDWPENVPRVVIDGKATALSMDAALYELLPTPAQQAWAEAQPEGTLDAELHYDTTASAATTRPAGLRVMLKPRQLAVTLKSTPYRLEKLTGSVAIDGDKVTLKEITGRHGEAKVGIAGTGQLGDTSVWDLHLTGEGLPVDDELRTALPSALAELADSLKLNGAVGFDLTKFVYRGVNAKAESADPEIDVAGAFTLAGGTLDTGVPLTDVAGKVTVDAAMRRGRLETLRGGIDIASMNMAGRAAKDFRADLFKPAGQDELRITKMRCDIADGAMSGEMTLIYPEVGPSRYALELVVREADVKTLAFEKDDMAVKGRLTASLSLVGSWGDESQRRGRGDVIVEGRDMYRIPLVLGLLQVTNLALPISSPFNEATAVYNIDGTRVVFDQIQLKARNMLMTGNGSLDFNSKAVDLAFTTDTPGGLMKLPFLRELWSGARGEMLTIHVRGTIRDPEVSAQSMGTFWTTVDKVFNGAEKADGEKKRRVK
jgi:hypothetical protein